MYLEDINVCTIISKNYLSFARTFTDSFLKIHPKGKVFVLLIDEVGDYFEPKNEKFTLVRIEEIGIKDLESFCFRYSVLEQNTGAKANFLKYLLEKYNFKKLAYFDPDILILNSLENLWRALDKKSIILTPHITDSISDKKKPSEYDILKSGSYNLGFIAISNTDNTKNFLNWWIPHLMEHGFSDVSKGLFTDQRWIDLVPSIFDDVFILRHPGYNVAYWNLMQREIVIVDNKITSNGKPVYFFHFSGFIPENIEKISKHQNRFSMKDLENIRPLFELYRDLLVENDYLKTKKWKCKFDYFDNGVKIPMQARRIYNDAINSGKIFGNPFETSNKNSFLNYLNEKIDDVQPYITRLWFQIYKERDDLVNTFPNILNQDRESFVKWIKDSGYREYGLDSYFMSNIVNKLEEPSAFNKKNFTEFSTSKMQLEANHVNNLGINIAGYLKGNFGIAEAARNYAKAIKNIGIPFALNNIVAQAQNNTDNEFSDFKETNPYPINLIAVNADQSDVFFNQVGTGYFKNKYNVASWFWEISDFPDAWKNSFRYFDEIWVSSSFVANSISKSSPIPVVKITPSINIDENKFVRDRKKFGLKENDFVFLFIFDFNSVMERKNPLGIVNAFKKAFQKNEDSFLVIKCINEDRYPSEYKKLTKEVNEKIKVLTGNFDKDAYFSLIASSDCYVSLHRSEGLGLTIAEAMYAKKPVIVTEYGGNVDFTNLNNSFPVKYKIIKIDKDYGPYKKGNVWADPDIEHASNLMKRVFDNRDEAKEIGIKGYEYIKNEMNSTISGLEIKNRLKKIMK